MLRKALININDYLEHDSGCLEFGGGKCSCSLVYIGPVIDKALSDQNPFKNNEHMEELQKRYDWMLAQLNAIELKYQNTIIEKI